MDVVLRDILVFLTSGSVWRHILDLIDIGLVAFFLYRMFLLIRGTQAVQLMVGVLLLGEVSVEAVEEVTHRPEFGVEVGLPLAGLAETPERLQRRVPERRLEEVREEGISPSGPEVVGRVRLDPEHGHQGPILPRRRRGRHGRAALTLRGRS